MSGGGSVLFLDLARQTGWCEGVPGERPVSGTIKFADSGSQPEAVFGGALDFIAKRLTAFRYRQVIFEAPLDPRWMKTNINTARILWGLPAVVGAVAYQTGHWNLREASVNDVRRFLLGQRPAKGMAKQAVISKLQALGFDPADDNEADAIAGWLYACNLLDPETGMNTAPLMAGRGG